MRVLIATGDWVEGAKDESGNAILGGSGHVRLGQYIPYSGHDISIGELAWHIDDEIFGVRDWAGVEHWESDVIIMQRWMHHTIPGRIKIAQKNGQIIVNDVDDWYWGLSEKNLAFQSSHPRVNPDENINHYKKTIGRSNAVITSTKYLSQRLSKFVRPERLFLMENHIEIDKFRVWEHEEKEHPVIGWVGSTGHRSGDLDILKYQYKILESSSPGVFRYHHSGHIGWMQHFYDAVGLGSDDVTILLPVPAPRLGQLMRFDIGVVPLVDNTFNMAKSWIKGLEYAAAGIPFLASPVEPYIELRERFGIGWVMNNRHDWENSFYDLKNPEVRQSVADLYRERLEPLDVKYGAAKWDAIITEIANVHK